jgi:hypothetical protein
MPTDFSTVLIDRLIDRLIQNKHTINNLQYFDEIRLFFMKIIKRIKASLHFKDDQNIINS